MKKALLCIVLLTALCVPLADVHAACGNKPPPSQPVPVDPIAVPEPGVLAMLAMGIAGLIAAKRKVR